jgi:hypothetical protein
VIIRSANPVANASFRWYKNGEEIQSAPSQAFYLASDSGFYHVRQFLGSCGSPFYDSVFVRYRDKPRPPRPELSISPGLPALCSDNFTLSFNPAPGQWAYQWYSDTGPVQGQTSNSYSGNLPGNFFVRIEAIENGQPNGCFNKSTDFPVHYTGPFSIAQPRINTVSTERIPGDTLRNRITWRRPPVPNPSVKETRIYRQTSVAGEYEQIGIVSNADTSFLDNSAEPWQKPWFYKIAAEAYCSGTSGPTYLTQASSYHKTVHLIIIRSAVSTALNLIWNAYEGFPVSTYRIYRGSSPDNLVEIDSVAGNILSYTDFPPSQAGNWFYSIEAETQENYLPWGRILATGGRKVRSNTRPTTQGIVVNDDSTLLENPLQVFLPESSISAMVYPNPSSGWFRIRGGMEGRTFELRCFDPVGKLCFSRKLSGNFDSMLELPAMSGVYFLELTSSGTRKFFRMLRN